MLVAAYFSMRGIYSTYKTLASLTCLVVAIATSLPVDAEPVSSIEKAISEIERQEGTLSPSLYVPLRQLGLRLQEEGYYKASIEPFRRMQHLVHTSSGVYSPLQTESVEHIIRSYIAMGDGGHADVQHEFLFDVAERSFDEDDDEMQAARWRLAGWYRDTHRHEAALGLYEKALDRYIDDPQHIFDTVRILRAEALTLYISGRCCASDKLAQASALVSTSEAFDREDKRRVMLDYADMLMIERRTNKAMTAYDALASENGEKAQVDLLGLRRPEMVGDAIRHTNRLVFSPRTIVYVRKSTEDWLIKSRKEPPLPITIGEPVPVCSAAVRDSMPSIDHATLASYYANVNLEVDADGRAHNVNVEGNTPTRLNRYLRAVLEVSRYRPPLDEDGKFSTGTLNFRQTFATRRSSVPDNLQGWNTLLTSQACSREPGMVASSAARP